MMPRTPTNKDRAAVLEAVRDIAATVPTDVLVALLPELARIAADPRVPPTGKLMRRWLLKLKAVELYRRLRPKWKGTDQELCERIASDLAAERVSARSVRRWCDAWNSKHESRIAAGPVGLLDQYYVPNGGMKHGR